MAGSDLCTRAHHDHVPRLQAGGAVRDLDQRAPALRQPGLAADKPLDQVFHDFVCGRVHTGVALVQDQDCGIACHGARQAQQLHLRLQRPRQQRLSSPPAGGGKRALKRMHCELPRPHLPLAEQQRLRVQDRIQPTQPLHRVCKQEVERARRLVGSHSPRHQSARRMLR